MTVQEMHWFRVPLVGMPGTDCVIPVTLEGRSLDHAGDPLPLEIRTHRCTETSRWMLNNDQTWLCQKHAAEVAWLAGDSIEDIEREIRSVS